MTTPYPKIIAASVFSTYLKYSFVLQHDVIRPPTNVFIIVVLLIIILKVFSSCTYILSQNSQQYNYLNMNMKKHSIIKCTKN